MKSISIKCLKNIKNFKHLSISTTILWLVFSCFIMFMVSAGVMVFLKLQGVDVVFFGVLGDAISGTIGTVISILSIAFIGLAFLAQIQANSELRESNRIIKKQGIEQIAELQESNRILRQSEQLKLLHNQLDILKSIDFDSDYNELLSITKKQHWNLSDIRLISQKIHYDIQELNFTVDLVASFETSLKTKLSGKIQLIYVSQCEHGIMGINMCLQSINIKKFDSLDEQLSAMHEILKGLSKNVKYAIIKIESLPS